jgi:nitrate/nitrite transporter NarK
MPSSIKRLAVCNESHASLRFDAAEQPQELAMNNQLATHFRTYFQMDAGDASALAGAFGLMNLFARSLGGISSDICYKFLGFRGRIWAQFLALFFEAIFLFAFGNVDNSQPWYVALAVLVCFSLFVQMAEGAPAVKAMIGSSSPHSSLRLGAGSPAMFCHS